MKKLIDNIPISLLAAFHNMFKQSDFCSMKKLIGNI